MSGQPPAPLPPAAQPATQPATDQQATGQPQVIRPYGDTTGDGRVQVSFTLPVPFGTAAEQARAEGAALQLAGKMGLAPAMVVHAKGMGAAFTFFIVYGRVGHLVDLAEVTVAEREYPLLSPAEVNLRIRAGLGRKLVIVGACIGTDAHTVGIDAILNVKGHAGEKGLEYYREIRVVNLGSQVEVPALVGRAAAEGADAVLVSQVVTQRDAHLSGARELSAAFSAAADRGARRPLLVVGGPRFDPSAAAALGVDKIFGRGTTPREVASYLAHALTPAAVPAAAHGSESHSGESHSGESHSGESHSGESHSGESHGSESRGAAGAVTAGRTA